MAKANCLICKKKRGVQGKVKPGQILVPLRCGHTYNLITGWCFTPDQLENKEQILTDTVNFMRLRYVGFKSKVLVILKKLGEILLAEEGTLPPKKKE